MNMKILIALESGENIQNESEHVNLLWKGRELNFDGRKHMWEYII